MEHDGRGCVAVFAFQAVPTRCLGVVGVVVVLGAVGLVEGDVGSVVNTFLKKQRGSFRSQLQ